MRVKKGREWRRPEWQMRHLIRSADELARYIDLTGDEREAIAAEAGSFGLAVPPYYASLMERSDPACPIRRQAVPSLAEGLDKGGLSDPLAEEANSPVRNVIRVYPDRVAFCINNECPLHCRFCLRKRMVGDVRWRVGKGGLEEGIAWIAAHREVRDVLLTGGDPLWYGDERLEWILQRLRAVPHVEIIRLGTRFPATLPFRITPALCRMLKRYHPVWVNTQFNHPKELTPEAARALDRLARAGIPLGNQSVLLKGINDDLPTMKALCEGLVALRVRPYYCYQPQLLSGTEHFRPRIEEGVALFRALRGKTSGFAIPEYVLDTPKGKVPLAYPFLRGREGDHVVVETFDGSLWREKNP